MAFEYTQRSYWTRPWMSYWRVDGQSSSLRQTLCLKFIDTNKLKLLLSNHECYRGLLTRCLVFWSYVTSVISRGFRNYMYAPPFLISGGGGDITQPKSASPLSNPWSTQLYRQPNARIHWECSRVTVDNLINRERRCIMRTSFPIAFIFNTGMAERTAANYVYKRAINELIVLTSLWLYRSKYA